MEFVALVVLLVDACIGLWAIQRWRRAWRNELSSIDRSRPPARVLAHLLLGSARLDQVSLHTSPLTIGAYEAGTDALTLALPLVDSTSLASLAVVAHEVGHALQARDDGWILRLRQTASDLTVLGMTAGLLTVTAGIVASSTVYRLGLVLLTVSYLLPFAIVVAERDASRRGLNVLACRGVLQAVDVARLYALCDAAALSYVALPLCILPFVNLSDST